MAAWLRQLTVLLHELDCWRPHLRLGRWLPFEAVVTASLSALFESFGIGLLAPLILLLHGNDAAVFQGRFLRWLPEFFPGRTTAVYVGMFCGSVLGAILLKNAVMLGNQRLLARFTWRISTNLRNSLFRRLQKLRDEGSLCARNCLR